MSGFLEVPGWALQLARRVLYCWVRTTVFPPPPQQLGLDRTKPVCYVLQDDHLENLLVLFRETQAAGLPPAEACFKLADRRFPHAVFSLGRRLWPGAQARRRHARSRLMEALVRDALSSGRLDVQIVPVVILWGRSPDKQDSILKALFSENWRQPGPLRRLLNILLHGRNVLVRFNPPISLPPLPGDGFGLDQERAEHKLARVLRVHFRRQRQMAIGPDLSHRNTQIDTLLAAAPLRQAIAAEAAARGITPAQAELRARRFALEIASDYSYGAVRALELFLSWLWARLYDGIEVRHIDAVTRIAPNQGIVYVPTHRSHIDYLLLSYVVHQHGLTPPHIAAGANLNLPLVGPLLRRCGAFFLRRSFKGEPLYAAVFHEYLHLMLTRGFPLEFFIEGGRSRHGRMLTPKAGILGMTVRSFIREHDRPLVFVPVYIGYEKLIEGRSYLRELAGKPKKKESLWAIVKSARRIKRVFGKVYINFGEPLPLADFLDRFRPQWAAAPAAEDWQRAATHRAAGELAKRINEAAVINPVNLIALALLSTPRHTADEQALCRLLDHYQALAAEAPYSAATVRCALDAKQIIAYAERLGIAERVAHPLGDLIRVPQGEAPLLAYFRNNVLHLFALPALIACLLDRHHDLHAQRVSEAVAGIYQLIAAELFLRWSADDLAAATEGVIATFVRHGLLLRSDSGRLSAPEPNSDECVELRMLGETLRPLLERHFLALSLLQRHGSGTLTRRMLEDDCHLLSQRLSLLYEFSPPEYAQKTTFAALIAKLVDADLLHEDEDGFLHFDQRINTPLAQATLVLPAEATQAIKRMARASLGSV